MSLLKVLLFASAVLIISVKVQSAEKSISPDKGFRAEIIKELNEAEEKVTALANDIPESKYSWRPEEGVRSVSEVINHVAGANYFFLTFTGAKLPEGMKLDPEMEKKITDKEKILEFVKKAYAFARDEINSMSDADLSKEVDFFGGKISTRHLLIKLAGHSHEHLGQLIAYARMNGITPSWSKKEN